jgi:hypothetical protein
MEQVDDNGGEHPLAKLLRNFEATSRLHSSHLDKWVSMSGKGLGAGVQSRVSEAKSMLTEFSTEANTWSLLFKLYEQLASEAENQEDVITVDSLEPGTEQLAVLARVAQRHELQRWNVVCAWFEETARNFTYNEVAEKTFDTKTTATDYWSETRRRIRRGDTKSGLVKTLDPDAPLTGRDPNAALAELDEEEEVKLLADVWRMLRSGQIDKAKKLCEAFGQSWRAASLSGVDPLSNVEENGGNDADDNDDMSVDDGARRRWSRYGNPNRFLWKLMCWKLSERGSSLRSAASAEYEKAIYGALSGNIGVCQSNPHLDSWEDQAWFLLQSRIDFELDDALREHRLKQLTVTKILPGPTSNRSIDDYMNKRLESFKKDPDTIFVELEERYKFYNNKFHELQSAVIRDTQDRARREQVCMVAQILTEYGQQLLEDQEQRIEPSFLRFLTHLALYYQELAAVFPYDSPMAPGDHFIWAIISKYIDYLIENHRINLVALFVSRMPAAEQYGMYAHFLSTVKETAERHVVLELADEYFSPRAGIAQDIEIADPLLVILIQAVINAIESGAGYSDIPDDEEGLVSDLDYDRLDSLRWLCFYDEHRAAALVYANNLVRRLMVESPRGKITAIEMLLLGIPSENDGLPIISDDIQDIIEDKEQIWPEGSDVSDVSNAIREYRSWVLLAKAMRSYRAWAELVANSASLSPPVEDRSIQHPLERMKAFEKAMKRYTDQSDKILNDQTEAMSQARQDILAIFDFKDGWLRDVPIESDVEVAESPIMLERKERLEGIRTQVLGRLITMYHTVLFKTGKILLSVDKQEALECLQQSLMTADIVADEEKFIYQSLMPNQLRDFLDLIHASSLELLRAFYSLPEAERKREEYDYLLCLFEGQAK